jgi:hypothetical protein
MVASSEPVEVSVVLDGRRMARIELAVNATSAAVYPTRR